MELLQLLDLLFFGIFVLLPFLIFYWLDDLFHICRKIGMLYFSVLYSSLLVLVLFWRCMAYGNLYLYMCYSYYHKFDNR